MVFFFFFGTKPIGLVVGVGVGFDLGLGVVGENGGGWLWYCCAYMGLDSDQFVVVMEVGLWWYGF